MHWEKGASIIKILSDVRHLSSGTGRRRCCYRSGLPESNGNARISKTKSITAEDSRQQPTEPKGSPGCSYCARCGAFVRADSHRLQHVIRRHLSDKRILFPPFLKKDVMQHAFTNHSMQLQFCPRALLIHQRDCTFHRISN